ncbi:MAG: hypothetical protein KDI90_07485 [Alphaproteobacteria bacterium]|nr:hypothetical protein [Alphaproteobacteria bacterium]MCB9975328.1 hypothetical protein [Rhodospirillales bacterium]
MRRRYLLILPFLLTACTKGQGISLRPFAETWGTPYEFQVCHGFNCTNRTPVALDRSEWENILKPFRTPAADAAEERNKIAQYVGLIETTVQQKTGMKPDKGEARTFERDQDQMDCLDETINTSRYLHFLEKRGILKWNEVADPVHRGYFVDAMWPHNSAAVKEKATGQRYAIDSYYRDNGQPADIVALEKWLKNWSPYRSGRPDRSSSR